MRELERYIGEVLDEKYRLERLLGRGGMGAVYLATHLGTERPVALKIIAPQLMKNEEFVERFKREARAAGRLRHPNVVDVTDFGFARAGQERVAYLVMEYLDGCTLADVLEEETRLPLDWVVDIMDQVCSALHEAHLQGIVHRDLKPDNIWLEPNRRGGYTIKVLDFGIAKLADSNNAATAGGVSREGTRRSLPTTSNPDGRNTGSSVSKSSLPPRMVASAAEPSREVGPSEAATLLQPAHANAEDQTRILAPPAAESLPATTPAEAQTEIFSPFAEAQPEIFETEIFQPDAGDQTLPLLDFPDAIRQGALSTAPAGGLTRVGSIMGTPLYMSPEQCRGERLDARSDIYSLGVIAYQMLAGQTPFVGDTATVMKMHTDVAPPPLKIPKPKVPKKVAQHVLSAMAKNPAERPPTAEAFASTLHAYSEGTDTLLRHAFALYSEHFPTFLKISLLGSIPVVAVIVLQSLFDWLDKSGSLPVALEITLGVLLALLAMIVNFLSAAGISGVTVPIVIQLHVAPLRPINIRAAFNVLRRRLRPFLVTSLLVMLKFIAGLIFFVIPGFIVLVRNTLYSPVVLMEGLEKRAAMKRARELMRRSKRTVTLIVLIQIALPFLLGAILGAAVPKRGGGGVTVSIDFKIYERLIMTSVHIFINPLLYIMTALLYLKTRQAGGETLKETIAQFEEEDAPRSKWQTRMRERMSMPSSPSR